ncbi:MAG: GAF and ANTAR domain-containing protein [Euzebya sp.]
MAPREALLIDTFVELTDTMVSEFDVLDFLSGLASRCVELFDVTDAGLMLTDNDGDMRLAASSSHRIELLEILELQHDQGPCPDAFRTGAAVQSPDLLADLDRWPIFTRAALDAGFRSATALPLRLRDDVIGALNLIRTTPGTMPDGDIRAAQALADVATIGILQHRAMRESALLSEQLGYALKSRVAIEQAKGVIAHHLDITTNEAFDVLRSFARTNNRRLVDCAMGVVDRSLDLTILRTP